MFILPTFGNLKLKDLTRVKYQKFINSLLKTRSKQTVSLINATMH
ncbi:hypothetical protein [Bacillus sp. FSL K6-0268]